MKAAVAVSVLVSVNEDAEDLVAIHGNVVTELEKIGADYEILYLVGRAPASAREQAHGLEDENPSQVRVIEFGGAMGKAGMLASGFERARGEVLFTVPGRFEVDVAVLAELHGALEEGADLAFAARTRGRTRTSARLQSEIFNRLVSIAAGTTFEDIASETRALRRQVVDEVPLYGDFYRYLPLLAERLGFRVRELPAAQDPRARSPIVHSPRIYMWRALDVLSIFFISRFTRHPLRLFGGVGSAVAATGFVILLVAAIQRFAGTPLADRPILVLGALLIGLGAQAFTIGLLGELILFFHARGLRDYRVSDVFEGSTPLPPSPAEAPEETSSHQSAAGQVDSSRS